MHNITDMNGTPLKCGDRVLVEFVVEAMYPYGSSDDCWNLHLETAVRKPGKEPDNLFALSSQVQLKPVPQVQLQ